MTRAVERTRRPRDRILDVAAELFYREGVRAVGVDTVVARAGVAKMTLYHHFPSKDDLVVAWLQRHDADWLAWFTGAVTARAAEPRARLLAAFDVLDEWFRRDDFRGCACLNAAAELADRDHPARRVVRTHKQRLQTALRQWAIDARLRDPAGLARQLYLLVEGATVAAAVEGYPDAARTARDAAAVLIAAATGGGGP